MIAVKVVILPLLLACVSSDPKVFLVTTGSGPGSEGIPPAQVDYPNRSRGLVDWRPIVGEIFQKWDDIKVAIQSICPYGKLKKAFKNKKKGDSKVKEVLKKITKQKIKRNSYTAKTVMKKNLLQMEKYSWSRPQRDEESFIYIPEQVRI